MKKKQLIHKVFSLLVNLLSLPDKKHSTTPSNLSESYAVDAMGSTSSNLQGILDNQLSFTNIMVSIWPFDEKSIGSYNTKIFDALVFSSSYASTKHLYNFSYKFEKYRWQKITAFCRQ